jgi:hypothetical protein
MASQARSRSAPFDVDVLYAIMTTVLGIGPALYISLLPDAIVLRWIRVLTFSWSIWLLVGIVAAIVAVSRPLPVFEPCIGVNSGAILVQPRDLDLANFTCVYPCFEPSLASNIRGPMEVKAISSFNLSPLCGDEVLLVSYVLPASLGLCACVPLCLSSIYTDFRNELKSGWRLIFASAPLTLASILYMLMFEAGLQLRNLPLDESFRNVGQWSVLVNTSMVILGAICTGWKPRIRIPGMSLASDWHIVDPIEELKLRGSMLSDIAPVTNQGMTIRQNYVPPPTDGFPGERLSRAVHTCYSEQARLDLEASRIMPYIDDVPPQVYTEKIISVLLEESGIL